MSDRPSPRHRCAARIAAIVLSAIVAGAPVHAHAQTALDRSLQVAFPAAETGFDPQAAGDFYSNHVNRAIFDPPYKYDYLARPYKIAPNTAVALPEISADGKQWTIRIKPGIYFADDPVFKGQRRELTAADYAYSIKRILDPRLRSNQLNVVEGRFVGADAVVAKAKETGKFDYDAPMPGIEAVDRYTLAFKLNFPDYELLPNLTISSFGAVAREVIDAYADGSGWAMANPVGTGPYRLKEWRRGQKIVLEANPTFRDERYPESSDPADRELVKKFAKRKLPLTDRVEISIIEESNPRMLAFRQGQLDYVGVPSDMVTTVLDDRDKLRPEFAKQGIRLERVVQPAISYAYFNMEDPVVGGHDPKRVALRRAVAMAYNVDEEIKVIRQRQGQPATQVVPPQMSTHDPKLDVRIKYDPAAARALLDRFGYKDVNGDGWREQPDGKPLLITLASSTTALDREYDDLWRKNLQAIGINVEFYKQKWPDLLKAARLGQLQMWRLGNINTTPEGFGFYGLLYGKHAGFSNLARFQLAEYDQLFEQARALPDSPERTKLGGKMSTLVAAYAPWVLLAYRTESVLIHSWVEGFKYNPSYPHPWAYLEIDAKKRAAFAR
jgi:ABC-type transport system substrate-binding protein